MPKARLGVALLLPDPVAAEVDGLRRALGDGALGRIPPHLTLVPPVNVREDRLDEALAVLRAAAATVRPFRLRLGPPATFHPDNPVVYLAAGGDLDTLHRLRDGVFREPLARPLTWPFVPHVTLADDVVPERIPAALAALEDYRAEVGFERVHLLQEGAGRTWSPIADAAFAPPAVVGRGGLPLELSVTDQLDPEADALAESAPGLVVTARRDGKVVGVAHGRVVVASEHRGQGIARHLMAAFDHAAAVREEASDRVRRDSSSGTGEG